MAVGGFGSGDELADDGINSIGSIEALVRVENVSGETASGPEFTAFCASGGVAGGTVPGAEVGQMEIMPDGQTLEGTAENRVPDGCDSVISRVRSFPLSGPGYHLAEFEVPADVLP